MRAVLAGLLVLLGTQAASAEIWIDREGECGDWRGRWEVEQESDGIWTGTINFRHVGGDCNPGTGQRIQSEVRASLQGDTFFALRRDEGGQFCSYYGRLEQTRIRGSEICEGGRRSPFTMTFRAERPNSRQEDEWIDDPRSFERDAPVRGVDRNFRR